MTTSRKDETRASNTRDADMTVPSSWRPAGMLPTFTRLSGWDYRWVRFAMRGTTDATNYQSAMQEGWRAVHPSEMPELSYLVEGVPGAAQDRIETGGLVLCKMPLELATQRDRHYAGLAKQQVQSVDATLKNEFAGDSRVQLVNERRTEVKFGTGSL
jgi:hypothetical protein